ncbi:glutathione S-transferase N-terminal domain-containing protein [Desulforhopalus vacuolatus]|uniref:glutathione S-transferase N-terminal domain-containing protein n=1 Tax=Desulforhopalus vacuolatus TaxID=40414 RepID=UPI0034E00B05
MKLYLRADCPYCNKVLNAVEKMGLKEKEDYIIINAQAGTPGRDMVLKTGGKAMVPFLIDGDHSMYESDDIIAWIGKKYAK